MEHRGGDVRLRRAHVLAALGCAALVPSAVAAATSAPATPLRLGAMLLDTSGQAYYAADEGFFSAAGFDVKLNVMNNGSSILAAVMSGSLDIGFASPASLILARSRGIAVRFIAPAALYVGPEPNTAIMTAQDSPVQAARDLTGKTIAVAGIKDITQFQAQAWIDRNGGDAGAVQFIELPYAEMAIALQQNRVSAACLVEPFLSAAKATCRMVGNLNAVFGRRYLLTGWFAAESWLQRNADVANRFRAVMQRTARWANGHHPESAVILAKYTKLTTEQMATLQRSHYEDSGRLDPTLLQPAIDVIVRYGKLAPLTATGLIASR
jgi:NitT/TauT family transport system substrate-binding protein